MLQSQMAGQGIGGLAAKEAMYQNAYQGATQVVGPPKTIASAISHVERLNERLHNIRGQVASIADTIGGPRPVAGEASKNASRGLGCD